MVTLKEDEKIPLPTIINPWVQIHWIFDKKMQLKKSGWGNYKTAKKHFCDFLGENFDSKKSNIGYVIDEEFDEYILVGFKEHIEKKGFSKHHTNNMISTTRQVIKHAITNEWIRLNSFINFSIEEASRETEDRTPYTPKEMDEIMDALDCEIKISKRYLKPYVKTGLGKPPQAMGNSRSNANVDYGWWRNEENMRWYFENIMDCKPVSKDDPGSKQHLRFMQQASMVHGGLNKLYERWGVANLIDQNVMLPYLYKLVAVTGLNPVPAQILKIDSYQESHPLTKLPYIRYWKERGSGEGEVHLELLEEGVMSLEATQNKSVKEIWESVIKLTEGIRENYEEKNKNYLFLYEGSGRRCRREVRDFTMDNKTTSTWGKNFVRRYNLRDRNDGVLKFTMARFRPSLVSRLVKQGVDIFKVKSILGHSNINTTIRYLDSFDFAPDARAKIHKTIETIRENRKVQEKLQLPIAKEVFEENKFVFSTGLALCKNVFNPPENIRTAANIEIGSPCTVFNVCLRCPNVIIMEFHLPRLFAMRRQYLVALERGISATTHRAAIHQNLSLLNLLLDPDKSDWGKDVLKDAEIKSEFIDIVDDPISIGAIE